MKDYYKIIGVSRDADERTIKNTYLLKLKKYHPDVYAGDKGFAEEKTAELNEAYEILKDETLRKEYDTKLNKKKKKQGEVGKKKNVEPERNWFQVFWDNIKYYRKKRKDKKLAKKKKKYAKKLKTSENKLTDEQIEYAKDKKKLTILIWCMIIAIVLIIFALT